MEESIAEAEGFRSQFNEEEIEVCEILSSLGYLVAESELRLRTTTTLKPPFLVRWGTQKRLICRGGTRRGSSTTSLSPPNNPAAAAATALSKSLSPLQSLQNNTISQPQVKVVGSPNTPLSFSPNTSSESDDKSSRHNKSKKRALLTEELRKSTEALADSKEVLMREIQNVKSYYNELLAYNKKLKAKRQQVLSPSTHHTAGEEPNLELSKSLDPGFNCVPQSHQVLANPSQNQFNGEQSGLRPYGDGQVQEVRQNLLSSSAGSGSGSGGGGGSGSGEVNAVGPPDICNLRAGATIESTYGVASSQPLNYWRAFADDSRTKAAEARRNRRMINQQKSALRLRWKGISGTVIMKPPPLSRR